MGAVRIVIPVLVSVYLLFQSYFDKKTGMVYILPNNIMLFLSLTAWTVYMVLFRKDTWNMDLMQMLLLSAVFYISSRSLPMIGKIMQPADAKAFMIIYLSSVWIMGASFAPVILLGTLIFGHTVFLVRYGRIPKKDRGKGRKPYFPFIMLGYLSVMAFCTVLRT